MPTYDYRCASNGRVLEVQHRMSEKLYTWGELCAAAGIEPGDTAADTPVERLATGGNIVKSGRQADMPPCAMGQTCCGARQCGMP